MATVTLSPQDVPADGAVPRKNAKMVRTGNRT